MGKELYDQYACAAEIFRRCDALRPGTVEQCFDGTEEELKKTAVTQPCMFAMELAAAAVLNEKKILADAVAGFSLGEVSAAVFAGLFDLETGFRLVCRRGELMEQEASRFDTGMAAVIKLTPDAVTALCEQFPEIYPVNFNCPGQISVAGLSSRMPDFSAAVRQAGGRAIPLKVSGAFHSPYMEDAARAFAAELSEACVKTAALPLYSDVTGQPYTQNVTDLLSRQICSPVRWETLIRNMTAAGIDTFVEIGPGKTLTGMIRKISPDASARSYAEYLADCPESKDCARKEETIIC